MSEATLEPASLLKFSKIVKFLPRNSKGKAPHTSTLHRWRSSGYRGIHLQAVKTPSGWCTSLAALREFFDEITNLDQPDNNTTRGSAAEQVIHHQSVERKLTAAGI